MPKQDPVQLLSGRVPNELALLVIDVQKGLFCSDPPPDEAGAVIKRINSVTARASQARIPVFLVQHDGPAEGDWLVPFSDGWYLHPELRRQLGDRIIRKTTADAFYGTNLEQELRSLGVRSLVLMGYATEFCVDSTLRNAVSKEFEVFVISDAHTTNDTTLLRAATIRRFFNSVWAETSSRQGIHLLSANDARFCQPIQAQEASLHK